MRELRLEGPGPIVWCILSLNLESFPIMVDLGLEYFEVICRDLFTAS